MLLSKTVISAKLTERVQVHIAMLITIMKKFADPRSRRMHAPRMPFESLQVSELIVVMEFMVITHQYLMMMNDKIGDRENLWHRSFDNYIIHDVRSYSVFMYM